MVLAVLQSPQAFLYGGINDTDVCGDLWEWNMRTHVWRRWAESTLMGPRYAFQWGLMGQRLLIMGGLNWNASTMGATPEFLGRSTPLAGVFSVIVGSDGTPRVTELVMRSNDYRASGVVGPVGQNVGMALGRGQFGAVQPMTTLVAALSCNIGFSSADFLTQECQPCGYAYFGFQTANDSLCSPCPQGLNTSKTGCVDITQCDTCATGYCVHGICSTKNVRDDAFF